MERRLRRQESASSALGGSSLPRPPNASASVNLPPTGAAASSHHTHGAAGMDPAAAKQWEDYWEALEGDHEELRRVFEKQQAELSTVSALLAEQKVRESQLRALEGQVATHEGFLKEVLQLLSLADGGRPGLKTRAETNTKAGLGCGDNGCSTSSPSIDAVRDAIQKQQRRLQSLAASEEKNQQALRTMRKEKENTPPSGNATASSSSSVHGADCLVPATVKELEEARQKLRTLEQRLRASEKDARSLTADLKKAEQEIKMRGRSVDQAREEADECKKLLASRDLLLSSSEKRYKAVEKELRLVQHQLQQEQRRHPNAPTAGAGKSIHEEVRDTTSNSVGDKHHTTTRHFRLLSGRGYVDLLRTMPNADFQAALRADISAAVHVPVSFLTNLQLHTVGEDDDDHDKASSEPSRANASKGKASDKVPASPAGVAVDVDIKHNSSVTEDAMDVLLLECSFPSLEAHMDEASAKVSQALRAEVAELTRLMHKKDQEAKALATRVKTLEAAVARHTADRTSQDTAVNAALEEAEATVKDLYAALESQRRESATLADDLARARAEAEAWQSKMTSMTEQLNVARKSTSSKQMQVATTEANARKAEKRCEELEKALQSAKAQHNLEVAALQESLQAANVEVGVGVFETPAPGVRLPSADLVEAVAAITAASPRGGSSSAEKKGILKAFHNVLLCEVAVATGTVPVQVTKCICGSSSHSDEKANGGTAALLLSFELAFYANPENTAHVRSDITQKLATCTFTAAMSFLEHQWNLSKSAAATAADKAALEKTSKKLQELLAAVEKKLDSVLTLAERKASPTAVEKIDLLVARLRAVEANLREIKDAATEKSRELKKAAASEAEAKDSVQALHEKVKRLEAALLEKQQRSANASLLDASLESTKEELETTRAKERDLLNKLQDQQGEVDRLRSERDTLRRAAASSDKALEKLQERIKALEQKASAPSSPSSAHTERVKQLEEALREADKDRAALKRQVGEMETDMNDFSHIQASLQSTLEAAQTELRGKRQDFDLLMKQVLRLEERERAQAEEIEKLKQQSGTLRRHDPNDGGDEEEAAAAATPSASMISHPRNTGNRRVSTLGSGDDGGSSAAPTARGRTSGVPDTVRTPKGSCLTTTSTPTGTSSATRRIMKRSNSSTLGGRVFSRTNTMPTTPAATTANAASTTRVVQQHPSATPSTVKTIPTTSTSAPGMTTIFTRSATAVTSVKTKGAGLVDAAPRLGSSGSAGAAAASPAPAATTTNPPVMVLHRQESRNHVQRPTDVVKNGDVTRTQGSVNSSSATTSNGTSATTVSASGNDVASLTRERRHVSPIIGTNRRPQSPKVTNTSGGNAASGAGVTFHRSQTATTGATYVRTPSGYRKANPGH